jgi:hypothetical protein
MNTTTVLLENLIQGFQTALWITLLLLTWIPIGPPELTFLRANATAAKSVVFGSILLAGCYWLGLIVDTAYYHVFIQRSEKKWFEARRHKDEPNLLDMVLLCMLRSPDIASLLKERQAHLRMFRVSMVNTAFITAAAAIFILIRLPTHRWPALGACILVGVVTFMIIRSVWRHLYGFYVTLVQTGYSVILGDRQSALRSTD